MKRGKTKENSNPETEYINKDPIPIKVYSNGRLFDYLLPAMSLMMVVLLGFINKLNGLDITRIGILTLITTIVAIFYIKLQGIELQDRRYSRTIISLSYLLSIILIIQPLSPEIISFWMLGGLIVSMLIDARLGLLLFINLTFILGVTVSLRPETTIQLLLIGFIMILMSSYLKRKATVILASIIILSTNITISFVINNFVIDTNSNYLSSILSITAVIICAYLLSVLYEHLVTKDMDSALISLGDTSVDHTKVDKEADIVNQARINKEADIVNQARINNEADIVNSLGNTNSELEADNNECIIDNALLDENHELINRIKSYSIPLYEHCRLIADLSYKGAIYIGANELLAKAGGLYHEVGKINGSDYIEEGLKLADSYGFPEELKDIIKRHNIKYDKPASVEASIVMLSDIVVTTMDYMYKLEESRYTVDKIIDNIFQMRMEKGNLDDSGLTIKDFKLLKDFYIKEIKILQ